MSNFNSKIHPVRNYTITPEQFHYLQTQFGEFNTDLQKFVKHILACTLRQAKRYAGSIPISSGFIEQFYPKAQRSQYRQLEQQNLITVSDYSWIEGKSREFKIAYKIIQDFQEQSPLFELNQESTVRYSKTNKVHIMSGRSASHHAKPIKNHPIPEIIQGAINSFKVCYFDREATRRHCLKLKQKMNDSITDKFRFYNDYHIFESIVNPEILHKPQDNIYAFIPAYGHCKSGRIKFLTQSASRAMKKAMYSSIENLHNYDLKSSQAVILQHLMKEANISCFWLDEYLNNTDAKAQYAAQAGIIGDDPEGTWKNALYCLFMGGAAPQARQNTKEHRSIERIIYEQLPDPSDIQAFRAACRRFNNATKGLKQSLQEWHNYLWDHYSKEPGNLTRSGSDFYIHNACNMPYRVTPSTAGATLRDRQTEINSIKRGVAAHLLQGLESRFIHELTLLSPANGFIPIGNEADGLICINTIPPEAIEQAKRLSGLPPNARLEEKPDFGDNLSDLIQNEDLEQEFPEIEY